MSFILFTGRGGASQGGGCLLPGKESGPGGVPGPGRGCAWWRPPSAAGGTHPTGMHSCSYFFLTLPHKNISIVTQLLYIHRSCFAALRAAYKSYGDSLWICTYFLWQITRLISLSHFKTKWCNELPLTVCSEMSNSVYGMGPPSKRINQHWWAIVWKWASVWLI